MKNCEPNRFDFSCKECAKYEGNCGYHHVDEKGHVNYEICGEAYADPFGVCREFEGKKKAIRILTEEERKQVFDIKARYFFDCPNCHTFFEADEDAFSFASQLNPVNECKCPVCGRWADEY